ncbi:hypothetical protein BCR34DRAFT_607080 [Clohesyomyces aquaticus]|uniref:Uncharacterized protein n=1 Tax=Clohesyomyces aquaticus TaxID=1231657 RepID=A0A1Y1YJ31_9PLEO|nr:hypothetical protein BCR34DRAFT_607080 [Clohesyomyces aquaticus]
MTCLGTGIIVGPLFTSSRTPSLHTSTPPRPSVLHLRRKSTNPQTSPENTDLQRQILELEHELQTKSFEAESASKRADRAEQEAKWLKNMAKIFWREEWAGMKDYMRVFSREEDVMEIEERILGEYGDLFGITDSGELGKSKRAGNTEEGNG